MGKIFLLLIVVGLIYGGYSIYSNISDLTNSDKLKSRYQGEQPPLQGKVSPPQKAAVVEKIKEIHSSFIESKPLHVLASSQDYLLIEAWGIVRSGEALPDGTILRSWAAKEALVSWPDGKIERRRFVRANEVLAKVPKVSHTDSLASQATSAQKNPLQATLSQE